MNNKHYAAWILLLLLGIPVVNLGAQDLGIWITGVSGGIPISTMLK